MPFWLQKGSVLSRIFAPSPSRLQYALLLGLLPVGPLAAARAQIVNNSPSTQQPPSAATTSPTVSRIIHGQVVNALNGVAIPRALVSVNSRQALTDTQGKFEFPQFADAQATVTVTKPGYSQSADSGEMVVQHRIADLDVPVEVKLYPYALITGMVGGSDGLPLSKLQVTLSRASYDNSGVRWNNAGFAMTNSRGEYRFLVPAGRYRVALQYNPRTGETGEAVLPVSYPQNSSTDAVTYLALSPGEEKHVDLRPRMGPTYPIFVETDAQEARSNLRFTAVDQADSTMGLGYSAGSRPGEYRIDLPSGSYLLQAQSENRDESLIGSIRVTVAGKPISGLVMHLAPVASIPVDIAMYPLFWQVRGLQQSSDQAGHGVTAQQLNLSLHNLSTHSDGMNQDIGLRVREDKTFEFRAPPGRYRLVGGNGGWYVESATYGGITNLLTSDIVLAPGAAGAPIHIVANNDQGVLHGQVAAPNTVDTSWVYLFPRQPSLSWPNPISTGGDGKFFAVVTVGSYSVVAFEHRLQEDLRDPEVLTRLTAGAKTVDITSGGNTVVNLDLSAAKERPQ